MDLNKPGMLPIVGSPVAGIDPRDPRVAEAARRLVEAGMPVNKVNLAVEMAVMTGAAAPVAPMMPAANVRGGPSSSFRDPAEVELELRRAEQLRIQQEAIRQHREKQRLRASSGRVVR